MNNGEIMHTYNSVCADFNRIKKVAQYAKNEFKDSIDVDMGNQEREIAESRLVSMIEQLEILLEEVKIKSYKLIKEFKNEKY